ncbi:uncharacterized protein LOC107489209 [Arachis duranensis]|uniref:Uncharacterized protein LOC107489209 n=1 Tax=Arachis duranensis TaxID=130453 RepID=A0A6P4DDZ9_ARADU|nr:uncharacterized protein LOC107489209 [Arachis duranensis]
MVGNSDTEHSTTQRWRFTWEAQSPTPTLRLLLFTTDTTFNPSLQCYNLSVKFTSPHSVLSVEWSDSDGAAPSKLSVPVPRVLVDRESPVIFRALSDHIEVKLCLLLPVNHPILSCLPDDLQNLLPGASGPLKMQSDVESLSSKGEVDFYCRRCSFQLNRYPLRNFVEMPSANWREVADNWFGACCCSFGGISEKLVVRYANSYACSQGICLLSYTSVTLCKDDLLESNFPEVCAQKGCDSVVDNLADEIVCKATITSGLTKESTSTFNHTDTSQVICTFNENSRFTFPQNEKLSVNLRHEVTVNKPNNSDFSNSHPDSDGAEDVAITPNCCVHKASILGDEDMEILGNKRSFLNGFLEDVFMARSSNLSSDIDWHEFKCPQCRSLLGAYPCCEGLAPVDGGVRLIKCCISTCVPNGGSGDIFSNYTVDRMFANQLVECASAESSFRFVIRELNTKSPVLQIVLLNPDNWSCFGSCTGTGDENILPKLQLQPIIKVLFSDCMTGDETQLRIIEEWATKNSAEDIFMLTQQIEELVRSLMSAKDKYPPSCASLQRLILSSLQR